MEKAHYETKDYLPLCEIDYAVAVTYKEIHGEESFLYVMKKHEFL